MPNVPSDLISLPDVLKQYKPSRGWWDSQIDQGNIRAYRIPGERPLFLSKSAVEAVLEPRPYERDTERQGNAG